MPASVEKIAVVSEAIMAGNGKPNYLSSPEG